jgi:CheY-like chemotaxis protein
MKILVIDDDKPIRETLRSMLELMNHTVDCAESAQAALELTKQNKYEFVFVDFKMPENDGGWFLEHAGLTSGTKALLMTALVSPNVVNRMFSVGVRGYLAKPFETADVLRQLAFHAA